MDNQTLSMVFHTTHSITRDEVVRMLWGAITTLKASVALATLSGRRYCKSILTALVLGLEHTEQKMSEVLFSAITWRVLMKQGRYAYVAL